MKAEKRLEAKNRGGRTDNLNPGEDPDIAGIVAGPQPRPEWLDDEEEVEDSDDDQE